MWVIVDCNRIIRGTVNETMCTKSIYFVLLVLLAHSAVDGKKKDVGVAHLNCPMDDDPNNPTHLPVEGDCEKFLKCSYGKAYKLSCPRGLHWSEKLDRCEAQEIAKCDPTATTPRPVLGGGGCTFSFKPHPTDCDKAIQCASGLETVVYCLENMYWNPTANRCDFDDSHC